MTYEISIPERRTFFGRLVDYMKHQYEMDVLRAQVRQERKELASLSDHALQDIGITHAQAQAEARRLDHDLPVKRMAEIDCRY